MAHVSCIRCGVEFQSARTSRKYCDSCRADVNREHQRRYVASPKGKAASRQRTYRWVRSDKGRAYMKQWDADGSKAAARQRAFRHTGKGRAVVTRANCIRAGVPFKRAVEVAVEVGDGRARCYWCGGQATEVEHVLPIGLAKLLDLGEEVDNYVDAMCKPCHRAKTIQDRADFDRCQITMPQS